MQQIMNIDAGLFLDISKQFLATGNDEAVINYEDDYWMVKSQSPDDVIFAASKVERGAMEEYSKPDLEEVGVRFKTVKKFLSGKSGIVTIGNKVEEGGHKMVMKTSDGKECSIPYTDSQYVAGDADVVPSLNYGVEFSIPSKRLDSFLKDSESIVGAGHFYLSVGEGLVVLYTDEDGYDYKDVMHAEDLEHFAVDWEACEDPNENPKIPSGAKVPSEDHRTDVIMSIDFLKSLNLFTDNITVYCDNHAPVKFVMDFESDSSYEDLPDGSVKCSYITAPRISGEASRTTLPEGVMPEREVLQ